MTENKPSITVIVPCLNEEGGLRGAVEGVKAAIASSGAFSDYEILIFNDGSTDKTGEIADELAMRDARIKAMHNHGNNGLGRCYFDGAAIASMDYTVMVPGDNEIRADALISIFSRAGKADIIVPYTANARIRPAMRRALSRMFVLGMNLLFNLNLRYYNGTCLIKTALIMQTAPATSGFAYMASVLVRLIRGGASYEEIGIEIAPRRGGRSKAFRAKNILSVLAAVARLFGEVRIKDAPGRARRGA